MKTIKVLTRALAVTAMAVGWGLPVWADGLRPTDGHFESCYLAVGDKLAAFLAEQRTEKGVLYRAQIGSVMATLKHNDGITFSVSERDACALKRFCVQLQGPFGLVAVDEESLGLPVPGSLFNPGLVSDEELFQMVLHFARGELLPQRGQSTAPRVFCRLSH